MTKPSQGKEEWQCEDCGGPAVPFGVCDTCRSNRHRKPPAVPAPVSAPGQSTPVETPPAEQPPRVSPSGKPVWFPEAAALAPGVGEGPRELTFAEAMALLAKGEPVECWARSRSEWELVPPLTGTTLLNVAKVWATQRYRRPEPLPAPAPRVSRVAEMAKKWRSEPGGAEEDLCQRVVEATLEAVRAEMDEGENSFVLNRARAAMLEPR